MSLKILSPAEQVASHVRDEILSGRWRGKMPGVAHLQSVFGVNHVTINGALQMLENEGILLSHGKRRGREIALSLKDLKSRRLRVRLLHYDQESRVAPDYLSVIDALHQQGYTAGFARKSLRDLGMKPERIANFVQRTEADAWIVSGASGEVFEWFANQEIPAIALFGRFLGQSIAGVGVRKSPIMEYLVRTLVSLGHRRIVLISHRERVVPEPALFERNFLRVLTDCGITTGPYNLPEWEPDQAGLRNCLGNLFRHTPPTAMIVDEPQHFIAVQNYLRARGIRVPEDVSLICNDSDPSFAWCEPSITHMKWSHEKLVNYVVRWVNQVAISKPHQRQKLYDAELVEGETIAAARK